MQRIKSLNEVISLLSELTSELQKHREEIQSDEVFAVQRETRLKIKQLMAQLEDLFPNRAAVSSAKQVIG